MKPMPPCKDCEDRELGCHSTCEKYIEFTKEKAKERKAKYDWYEKVYWKQDQVRSKSELHKLTRIKR